jgi:type IV pilus assembly protein PilB
MRLPGRARPAPPPEPTLIRVTPTRPTDTAVHKGGNRLGEMLVDAGIASESEIVAALSALQHGAPQFLGERLVAAGVTDEPTVAAAVAHQRGLQLVDLSTVAAEPAAVELLSEEQARAALVIPLAVRDGTVDVAVAVPTPELTASLQEVLGRPVRIWVATRSDITRAIARSYRAIASVAAEVRAFEAQHRVDRDTVSPDSAADDAPVVRIVQMIITQALRDRASDIHIEPHPDKVLVRYRIDGALHDVLELPVSMGPVIASRIKIMASLNIVERRRAQDGQISLEIEGRGVDIRVSTTAVLDGEKIVLRLLDKGRQIYELSQLGMPDDMVARYSAVLRAPYGMVICAGPTGSGKTTTLYGSLAQVNSRERNIMTIEDPVEYRIPSVNQIQINEQAGITFAGGLRSILRQDPDVILVGEIRDVETARIAVQAALTGHFVFSSLHATDAAAALHRLLDMGIEGFLIASSVTAVLSQRLVRRICDNCREIYQPAPEELALLRAINGVRPEGGFVRGRGCNFCAHTGFYDRTAIYEMMIISDRIRELVVERASHEEIRKTARAEGMRTMQEEAARLVAAGVTTAAEVLRSIYVVGN